MNSKQLSIIHFFFFIIADVKKCETDKVTKIIEKVKEKNVKDIEFLVHNCENLLFKENSFDIVIILNISIIFQILKTLLIVFIKF